jgi:hypothetical protein
MGQGSPGFLFSGYEGVFHWGKKQLSHEVQHPFAPHAQVNTLNIELNPICYLLALLGAQNFLHISDNRVE